MRKNTPRHIIIRLLKKHEGEILKKSWRKKNTLHTEEIEVR